jgi:hypothetical protein
MQAAFRRKMIKLRALTWPRWTALVVWLVLTAVFTPTEIAESGWWIPWMRVTGGILVSAILASLPAIILLVVLESRWK